MCYILTNLVFGYFFISAFKESDRLKCLELKTVPRFDLEYNSVLNGVDIYLDQ